MVSEKIMVFGGVGRDWLPETRSGKMLKKGVRFVKGTVKVVQSIKARVEKINKARSFNDAQKRAQEFKDWYYLHSIEQKRLKGLSFKTDGLKLGDFVWQDKEKRVIDKEKEIQKVMK